MIAKYTGAKYCSIMPNGTLSLSVALMACGVGGGDEVICPDYTMVATPNVAELFGAKAVFVDIDRQNLCMDLEQMKAAVTDKTKLSCLFLLVVVVRKILMIMLISVKNEEFILLRMQRSL